MPKRIPTHRPAYTPDMQRLYETTHHRLEDHAFYTSRPWVRLRKTFLSHNPMCAECERQGTLTLANTVHHKQERKNNPDLALEWDNLESLCAECHNRIHKAH